ncbi:MAG: permease-like cell division protein FtsX [Polyangiales bacterium]
MDLKNALVRARRGVREERRLYIVAITSLFVAFLCLGATLLAVNNLQRVADRWGQSGQMTVYLQDSADPQDIVQLRVLLEGLPEVAKVDHVTSELARELFVRETDVGADLASLPAEAFPQSLEVKLVDHANPDRVEALAARVGQFRAVSDVETYGKWFEQLDSLMKAGEGLALGLAALVAVCVIAVIANTIRLSVARRRQEIEVMKYCGATNGFVRGPPRDRRDLLQGLLSAALALLALFAVYALIRGGVDSTIAALLWRSARVLKPRTVATVLVFGAIAGAVGSAISVRRYLSV